MTENRAFEKLNMQLDADGEAVAGALGQAEETRQLFGIGDLAAEFGISTRAIRFYEDKGLLAPERVNGARIYSRKDRARLALILRAKRIGSSLSDIKHYLELYGDHGEGREEQLLFVIERSSATLNDLRSRRHHLDAMINEIEEVLAFSESEIKKVRKRKRGD